MAKYIMNILVGLLLAGVAFYAGAKVKERCLLQLPMYKLKENVKLQLDPDNIGELPAGSTIYEFDEKGETTTYIVVFNLKNRMILEPFKSEKKNLVDPLDAYIE
ncbi:hypothetical protein ACL7TT_19730 [Microbulbifer sp. 2304DJ12-6]|uniref:hypothetical protein n=1 Tax=Microbulbifer sp. 2304DJ12-6 TaxID=3233340 RepID=UPI0039B023A8